MIEANSKGKGLSLRTQTLKASPTLVLAAQAKALQAKGHPVISLSVGEPDWRTLPSAEKGGLAAIEKGFTTYTPANGMPQLREVLAQQFEKDIGIPTKQIQVSVTAGAKFSIFAALQALVDPGDEVVIPGPYWVSYPTMVELAGGRPVIVPTLPENHFRVTAAEIKKVLTQKTKVILLNSPSNPTGEVFTKNELKDIAEVVRSNPNLFVISDDIYNRLIFDGSGLAPHLLHLAPDLKDRVISVNGASKSLSMTGWRLGWAIGPVEVIEAMTNYQSQALGCAPSMAQAAVLEAIPNLDQELKDPLEKLKTRRDLAYEEVRATKGFQATLPGGAFYLWVDIRGTGIKESSVFCERLLKEKYVAIVPGVEFGQEGFIRMSYAVSPASIQEAFQRIRSFVELFQR